MREGGGARTAHNRKTILLRARINCDDVPRLKERSRWPAVAKLQAKQIRWREDSGYEAGKGGCPKQRWRGTVVPMPFAKMADHLASKRELVKDGDDRPGGPIRTFPPLPRPPFLHSVHCVTEKACLRQVTSAHAGRSDVPCCFQG